jgi:uncharacterized secreted protein with C-terminal beta-propeller domain
MTADNTNQQSFQISTVGVATAEIYQGEFVLTRFLSNRQHFLQDQLYRQYLGGDPQFSQESVRERAEILSEINAYCVNFPEFWEKCGRGFDLVDNNVLIEVYAGMNKVYAEIAESRKSKVEASVKKLKEMAEKAEKSVQKTEA